MKRILFATTLAAFVIPAFAQVSVSIGVGNPDFHGQIIIGGAPPPRVV